MINEFFKGWSFCPNCDWANSRPILSYLCPDRTLCPECGQAVIADFYSYGSRKHKERWTLWKKGRLLGRPVPFPRSEEE